MTREKGEVRYYARVKGYVQGVGFRYFVRTAAQRMGLTGWVRNRDDGDVELEAQGPADRMEVFLDTVRAGNRYAEVEGMETRRLEPERESAFRIADWI